MPQCIVVADDLTGANATDSMLDALGSEYVAVSAPCFPSSGRIVVGGYMLVKGFSLHQTEVAPDPKTPITLSDVKQIFQQQSNYEAGSILMSDIAEGKHHLANRMKNPSQEGCRILIADCVIQEPLQPP